MQAKAAGRLEIQCLNDDDPMVFFVRIIDAGGETRHEVTLAKAYAQKIAADHTPAHCIEAAFCFLLDREAKEQILSRFDISVIARYFPAFEREVVAYLNPS